MEFNSGFKGLRKEICVCVCFQTSIYILTASSQCKFYHILSFQPPPTHLNPYITTSKPSSLISCFMWEKGIVVCFVGFKSSFSNSLIDSWEAGLLSCGAKLLCSQYIVLYEMLIYYGFVVIFKGRECGCPRICCKLLVVLCFIQIPSPTSLTHPLTPNQNIAKIASNPFNVFLSSFFFF